mmetsp:Transcript_11528/g.38107  ORF Transcript_11528/g.38107 Transcript_11528/m.38107 type:complete len:331 (+) Transcript_11528:186-1178(+)
MKQRSTRRLYLRVIFAVIFFLGSVTKLVTRTQKYVPKKFAAVMFDTSYESFGPPLEDLLPHLSTEWVVRIFLPLVEGNETGFLQSKNAVLQLPQIQTIGMKNIQVHVIGHVVTVPPGKSWTEKSQTFGVRIANNFALSQTTYTAIEEQHLLFFQKDSCFCAPSINIDIKTFMRYKWLGAPWNPMIQNLTLSGESDDLIPLTYGNGGLSVRSKDFILDCLNREEYKDDLDVAVTGDGMPEDVFFTRCLFDKHKEDVHLDQARRFSVEELYPFSTFFIGAHDPCRVADKQVPGVIGCSTDAHKQITRALVEECPQVKRIIRKCVDHCSFGFE